MILNNVGNLSDKQQEQVKAEVKKVMNKRKNLASSEMFKVNISGAIVRGVIVDNGSTFAIEGIVPMEEKKKPAAKKQPPKK